MTPTRRRMLAGTVSVGGMLLAGCIGDDDTADEGDPNGNDTNCEPIELPLVDDPPHAPERPPHPDSDNPSEDWNADYLGEGMDEASDVDIERVNVRPRNLDIDPHDIDGDGIIGVELITSQEALDDRVEATTDDDEARLAEVDFDEQVVLVIVSGFGSSTVTHEWVRAEEHCDQLHLHGYYRQPYVQTGDYVARTSGVIADRQAANDLDAAWVSLTVREDVRVNASSDDEIQVINGEDTDSGGEDELGPIEHVDIIDVKPDDPGEWWSTDREEPGIAYELSSEDDVRALTTEHEDVERFIEAADFDTEFVYYVESAGPNACYNELSISDTHVVADDDGYFLQATATVLEDDSGGACAEVITHPATLVRIDSEVDLKHGAFRMTDGWDEEGTVRSVPYEPE